MPLKAHVDNLAGGAVFSCKVARDVPNESGRGQPHSKTSRRKWRARERASPAVAGECGCPLPLYVDAMRPTV
jgi:hypothetical protein